MNDMISLEIKYPESLDEIGEARMLFEEYATSLNFSLCFQGFDQELANLPGEYAEPDGRLLLARHDGKLAGCIALRKIDDGVCEMKRLFVRSEFRGRGIGRALAEKVIADARTIGYSSMRLDTLASMREAITLYRSLGFTPIEAYRFNPLPHTVFMELTLL